MEENVILDCIVVANAISNSTHDDKTTSESDRNDHDGQTDDVPAQDTNLDDRNKPGGMRAQALIIKSRFNLSPSGRKSLVCHVTSHIQLDQSVHPLLFKHLGSHQ